MYEIIIRGNKSFIGKNFILKNKHNKNISIYNKSKKVKKNSILLHLTAETSVLRSIKNPSTTLNNNLSKLIETLEYCQKNKCKLIFFSTAYQKEKNKFTSPYSYSKHISEEICKYYAKNFNIDICVLKLTNVFGSFQKNKLIPDLIEKMNSGINIDLINYNLKRDYIYIDDLISAINKVIKLFPKGYNSFNLSQNKNIKILDVCLLIKVLLNSDSKIVKKMTKDTQSNFKNKRIDNSKFSKKYKWKPKFDLEGGLKNFIKK